MTDYDVVIIGAGPAGSSAAYHLAARGRRVLMLDRQAFPRDKACGDGLTPRSVELLAEMGLLDALAGYQKMYGGRILTRTRGYRDSMYRPPRPGHPNYGLVISRRDLDHLIVQKAREAGATLWEKATVTRAVFDGDRVCGVGVRRNGIEAEIAASFVIAADGGNSHFARRIGLLEDDRWSVGFAVRGYYRHIHDLEDLFMVYVPLLDPDLSRMVAGYGWVFPMGNGEANIGVGFFPSQQQDFDTNVRRIFDRFVADLQHQDARFAGLQLSGRLQGAPLRWGLDPSRCVGRGVMLVGDAAGLVDPFTGEGIHAALQSGKFAAQVLEEALRSPDPAQADLTGYARLLETRFQDLFRMGRQFVKTYGFMWNLLDGTFNIDRPFFTSFHRAIVNYGVDGDFYTDLALPEDLAWLAPFGILDALENVRSRFAEAIRSGFPLLSKLAFNLLDLKGSCLRSTLLLLAGHFGDPDNPARIEIATAIELACLASTIHDDVLETAPAGAEPGINWANTFAITAGDYLMVRAYELVAALGSEVSQLTSRASAAVCTGKMMAIERAHAPDQDEAGYLMLIEKKTATFYEIACRLGARVSSAPEEAIEQLAAYGRHVGMAFQLTQDILEILADDRKPLTHPLARALEDGLYTLPLLYSLSAPGSTSLQTLIGRSLKDEDDIRAILAILRTNGSLQYVRERARVFVEQARACLDALPDLPARQALAAAADFVVDRVRLPSAVESLIAHPPVVQTAALGE